MGFSRSGKRPVSLGAVVFLDVLAGAGDGQQVEQLEVVEAEHVQQTRRSALRVFQSEPAVELELRLPNRRLDARNAVVVERRVVRPRSRRRSGS